MTAWAHPVLLRPATYQDLVAEAARRRVGPDELADEIVRERLAGKRRQPREMHDALAALDALSAWMPEVDAVRLVRDARHELNLPSAQRQP